MSESSVKLEIENHVAYVTMDRPELRNAFNESMIAEITELFESLAREEHVRVVVLEGAGESFCAGADLNWMQRMVHYSIDENIEDAQRLHRMFEVIALCPKPVLARVQGAAMGGGVGLVAAVDMAFAEEDTVFAFTEVKLGLIPAVISPFVVQKIGEAKAREFFLTGEKFSAEEAEKMGLIVACGSKKEMDAKIEKKIRHLLSAGPEAMAACKKLMAEISPRNYGELSAITARAIAERRSSSEGQEGMQAFLEKRAADWVLKS